VYALDADVVSMLAIGRPARAMARLASHLDRSSAAIPSFVFFEVERGFQLLHARGKHGLAERLREVNVRVMRHFHVLPFDERCAQPLAHAMATVSDFGDPSNGWRHLPLDAIISSTAAGHGLPLLTGNIRDHMLFASSMGTPGILNARSLGWAVPPPPLPVPVPGPGRPAFPKAIVASDIIDMIARPQDRWAANAMREWIDDEVGSLAVTPFSLMRPARRVSLVASSHPAEASRMQDRLDGIRRTWAGRFVPFGSAAASYLAKACSYPAGAALMDQPPTRRQPGFLEAAELAIARSMGVPVYSADPEALLRLSRITGIRVDVRTPPPFAFPPPAPERELVPAFGR
jgi:predicted nucleic acid-binding protein